MILLRTEHDRPAVFLEHHPTMLEVKLTHILCGGMAVIGGILPNGGLQILARATAENFIRGDKTTP